MRIVDEFLALGDRLARLASGGTGADRDIERVEY
jgi:hypothetical protein